MSTLAETLPAGYRLEESSVSDDPERSDVYTIQTGAGRLITSYRKSNGNYTLVWLDVKREARKYGVGTQLVRIAFEHARDISAEAILAQVTSRESYEVMKKVFGEQYLEVNQLGEFAPDGCDKHPTLKTSASLCYDIPADSCIITSDTVG